MHLTFEIFSLNHQIIHQMADKKLGLVRKRTQNCLLFYVLQFFFIHAATAFHSEFSFPHDRPASKIRGKTELEIHRNRAYPTCNGSPEF